MAALLFAIGLPGFTASAVQAGDTLQLGGIALEAMVIQSGVATDIRRTVDLNGDQPVAIYAMASNRAGTNFVRTRQGYWLPWSGRTEDLVESGFTAQSGRIEFKLLKEELARAQLPITVTLAYRTAAGIKFGFFEIRTN